MANIIDNRLVMSGPEYKVIKEVITTLEEFGMSYWSPMPAAVLNEVIYPRDHVTPGWWLWAKAHWGCKWDMTNAENIEVVNDGTECYGILHFNTANASIEVFVDMLQSVFKEYTFELEYTDIDDGVNELHTYNPKEKK